MDIEGFVRRNIESMDEESVKSGPVRERIMELKGY